MHNQHQRCCQVKKQNNMYPKLKFLGGFNDLDAGRIEEQGSAQSVLVELEDGRHYQVTFYDTFKVVDNVKTGNLSGTHFEAEPGMIVLEKVTLKNMTIAVKELASQGEFGFFTYLKEWNAERDNKYFEKYYQGMPRFTYAYPTASED